MTKKQIYQGKTVTAFTPHGPTGEFQRLVTEALSDDIPPVGEVAWWPALGAAVNEYLSEPPARGPGTERALKSLRQKMRSIDDRYVVENVTSKDDAFCGVLAVRASRHPVLGVVCRVSLREVDLTDADVLEYVAREIHRSPPNSLRPVR